ncbi:hypothetical protein B0I37DRAFT_240005 [Chaetomium sp. MPI-CAGE-AT-0009]|nr:hypothetical protein B0I37DRAFT_240005 [Chaetomium sp. MPI-CAGE-AT-0009]
MVVPSFATVASIFESIATDRPHAHALLHHGILLHDDNLTTSEMATATGIISSRCCVQGFHHHHQYIPVTIFSASFRDFRIVQVWHDREDPNSLHVRRSPTVDFVQGEETKRDDWIAFCCWFMGEQLDNTMPAHAT